MSQTRNYNEVPLFLLYHSCHFYFSLFKFCRSRLMERGLPLKPAPPHKSTLDISWWMSFVSLSSSLWHRPLVWSGTWCRPQWIKIVSDILNIFFFPLSGEGTLKRGLSDLVMLCDSQTRHIFHFEYKIAFVFFSLLCFRRLFKITTEQSTTVIKETINRR